MGKLHELLAVEGSRRGAWVKVANEAIATFGNKATHFLGHTKTLKMFDEELANQEDGEKEVVAMTTTVPMKLNYVSGFFEEFLDVVLQKEMTNQKALGSITIGSDTFEGLPATFLLGLESKLEKVREVVEATPTHQPGINWVPDTSHAFEGVMKGKDPKQANKSVRTITPVVVYEATFPSKEQGGQSLPAQVEKVEETKPIGTFTTETWSGMLSPAQKSGILRRVDEVAVKCKKARMKANEVQSDDREIAKALMNYILSDEIRTQGSGVPA